MSTTVDHHVAASCAHHLLKTEEIALKTAGRELAPMLLRLPSCQKSTDGVMIMLIRIFNVSCLWSSVEYRISSLRCYGMIAARVCSSIFSRIAPHDDPSLQISVFNTRAGKFPCGHLRFHAFPDLDAPQVHHLKIYLTLLDRLGLMLPFTIADIPTRKIQS